MECIKSPKYTQEQKREYRKRVFIIFKQYQEHKKLHWKSKKIIIPKFDFENYSMKKKKILWWDSRWVDEDSITDEQVNDRIKDENFIL